MNGHTDKQIERQADGQTNIPIDEWRDGWTNKLMERWKEVRRRNGQTVTQTK
jgi:hypothetical protein